MTDILDKKEPSIVILNTGEKLITVLQEAYELDGDEKKGVCLVLNHPYVLELVSISGEETEQDLQVKFSRWCPYAIDTQFKVPYSSVVSIGTPDQGLSQAYLIKVEQAEALFNSINKSINQQLQEQEVQKVLENTEQNSEE